MVNFYRKLIPKAADVLLPLTEAIKHNPAAKTMELSLAEKQASVTVKDILTKVSALKHPDPEPMQYYLDTDSSNYVVGGALHQIINGYPVPIDFYSKNYPKTRGNTPPFIENT